MDWWPFFFSFRGRINRAKYWLALLIFFIVDVVLGLLEFALGNAVTFHIFSFLVNLAVLVATIAVSTKRLHDRDRSAWWLFLFFMGPVLFAVVGGAIMWAGAGSEEWSFLFFLVRLCLLGGFALGIWGLVEMGFLRGTAGYNRFGPDPLGKHHGA